MKHQEMRMQPRLAPGALDQGRRVHIPNLLTMGRVVLAIVFIAMLSTVSRRALAAEPTPVERLGDLTHASTWVLVTAAAIFIIAALTDALDGHLARKWKVESKFGRIMDPMADKLLVLGGFILLAGPGFTAVAEGAGRVQVSGVAGWMVVVMVARELLVTSIRGVYEADGVDFSAGWSGKAKMILQSVVIPLILLLIAFTRPGPDTEVRTLILILTYVTTAVTFVSGFPYVLRAARHAMEQQQKMMHLLGAYKPRKSTAMPSPKTRAPKKARGGQGGGKRN
jgi:CDP-diacylglycerol---glycerol-3-phosphate 3-phosphatidyltransferase